MEPGDSNQSQSSAPNRDWPAELTGLQGYDVQQAAHSDLSRHLYERLWHYLHKRAQNLAVLRTFSGEEFGALAEDFVQDTLEKVARDDFAILDSYAASGSFKSWITQVAVNIASSELRRPYWARRMRHANDDATLGYRSQETGRPKAGRDKSVQISDEVYSSVEQSQLARAIAECRETLKVRYRNVFDSVIVDGQPTDEVAQSLGISVNAVYVLVSRVKRKMRNCLRYSGFGDSL